VPRERALHPIVAGAEHREAPQSILLELERGRAALGGGFFAGLVPVGEGMFVVEAARPRHRGGCGAAGLRIAQAVHCVVDLDLAAFNPVGERENLRNRRGAGRDGLHHVAQSVLDPLGDCDLGFARQQFHRSHLAQVHPHRIGGAAEIRIDCRERGFGFFGRCLVRHGGRRFRHLQHLGIGGFVAHADPDIVDRGDHALDLIGIQHAVGQVVVDLGVGDEAALLAERDEVFQARAARGGVDGGELLASRFAGKGFLTRARPSPGARLADGADGRFRARRGFRGH